MQNSMNDRFGVNQLAGARTVSISAEDTNARTISLQAQDREGQDLYARCAFEAYLSSDAVGDALEAASAGLTTVAGTDGIVCARSAGNSLGNTTFLCVTEADGDLDITITETSGANTFYLNVILPDGSIWTSEAITFAA